MSATISTLEKELKRLRAKSITLLESRKSLAIKPNPTDKDLKVLERLRVEINASRKEERFLRGRIKSLYMSSK